MYNIISNIIILFKLFVLCLFFLHLDDAKVAFPGSLLILKGFLMFEEEVFLM